MVYQSLFSCRPALKPHHQRPIDGQEKPRVCQTLRGTMLVRVASHVPPPRISTLDPHLCLLAYSTCCILNMPLEGP